MKKPVKGSSYDRNGKRVIIPDYLREGATVGFEEDYSYTKAHESLLALDVETTQGEGVPYGVRQSNVQTLQELIPYPEFVVPNDRATLEDMTAQYVEEENVFQQYEMEKQLDEFVGQVAHRSNEYRTSALFAREYENSFLAPSTDEGVEAKRLLDDVIYSYQNISSEEIDFVGQAAMQEKLFQQTKKVLNSASTSLRNLFEPMQSIKNMAFGDGGEIDNYYRMLQVQKSIEDTSRMITVGTDQLWDIPNVAQEIDRSRRSALDSLREAEDAVMALSRKINNHANIGSYEKQKVMHQLQECHGNVQRFVDRIRFMQMNFDR